MNTDLNFEILRQVLLRLTRKQISQYAADVVHGTLQILIENIATHRYPPDPSQAEATAYAIGILKHVIAKALNRQRAEWPLDDPRGERRVLLVEEGNPESAMLHQESEAHRQGLASLALKFYRRLPMACKQLIRLHVLDGLSYAEISLRLGRPKQTLVSQFNRCIGRLREKIEQASYKK